MLRIAIFFVCFCISATPLTAFASAERAKQLSLAINAMKSDDWPTARRIVARIPDAAAKTYSDWRRLRGGEGVWREYVSFLDTHADWPGLPLLRKIGETKIPVGRPAREILSYFKDALPQTGRGALRLAEAFEATGQTEAAQQTIRLAWLTLYLSKSERETIEKRYRKTLAKLHWARADHLVWVGQFNQALALKPYLTGDQIKLLETRVALRRGQNGVNKMIDALPKKMASDPGLAYDRFRWRLRKEIYDGGEELLRARSVSREALGRPEIWSDRRSLMARRAMRAENYELAYELASLHRLEADEAGYTDLEWLSGYLKLIYLDDAEKAVEHFRRLRYKAVTPITQGRVWYWLGRAHEATGNGEKSIEAYEVAAQYQTSFYGQMAAGRLGVVPDPAISDLRKADWSRAEFQRSLVFQAGALLQMAGEQYEAGRFFAHMAETMDQSDQSKLGQFLIDLNEPNMALRVAKNAARQGRVNINSYYPVTELADLSKNVPPELVMAIARQESELNQNVESPVGAQGMMQVMPRTAREVAKKLGQPYSLERLKTDWRYNASLGIGYLDEMLKRYNGSIVLTAAAYNAGPHRADRWIREHGDPRLPGTNTEQWIEKIQFRETRNYVQRVLESVQVYRARLTGDETQMALARDLKAGG